jgi:hypothetical protein
MGDYNDFDDNGEDDGDVMIVMEVYFDNDVARSGGRF